MVTRKAASYRRTRRRRPRRLRLRKLLTEGLLIVFSVLFALFINRAAENWKTREAKNDALDRIYKELNTNDSLVTDVLVIHERVVSGLESILYQDNDSLRRVVVAADHSINLGPLIQAPSFYARIPSASSWEAAHTSGIVAEFDYETIERISQAYESQHRVINVTLQRILELFFTAPAADIDTQMRLLHGLVRELAAQERTLLYNIKQAKAKLRE